MHSFPQSRNRHTILSILALAFGSLGHLQADAPTYKFVEKGDVGRLTKVQIALEVSGQLKINADGKQVTRLPLTGKGELLYDEKLLPSKDDSIRRSVRHYRVATATSRVGDKDFTANLNAERRLIASQASPSSATLLSPLGPLNVEELELIDVQANSLLLARLLPTNDVSIGDTWSHDESLSAALFGLDVVTKTALTSVLKRVEDKTAFMEMSGTTSGSVAGVASDIELTGKYSFDLATQRIVWLAMSIKETRAIGHAEPGFEMTARLRMSVLPGETCPELSDEILSQLPLDSTVPSWLTLTSTAGGFRLVQGRDWHLMVDRNDVTILRLIQRGELIAQCNISRLPDAASGKQLAMKSFQADIQRVLDKNFGQFVEATESKNDHGLRVLRTVVSGVASSLPIHWTYYHLTDDQGRQVSLVFTMDAKLVERFAAADQTLVASLEVLDQEKSVATVPVKLDAAEKKP